jgi:hypothetical protein
VIWIEEENLYKLIAMWQILLMIYNQNGWLTQEVLSSIFCISQDIPDEVKMESVLISFTTLLAHLPKVHSTFQ